MWPSTIAKKVKHRKKCLRLMPLEVLRRRKKYQNYDHVEVVDKDINPMLVFKEAKLDELL